VGETIEVSDWAAVLNIEYQQGTNKKYLAINVVKRRRIESGQSDMSNITYLAHPFDGSSFRLIDDFLIGKILSLNSLVTDVENVGKEKTNAVPRLKQMEESEFEEDENYES
jgi:hypothetical protein